ncbi:hypothetical protein ES705_32980 [subsurface metagenome]
MSKSTGGKSKQSLIEDLPGSSGRLGQLPSDLEGLRVVIAQNCKDISEVVTAVNRIERKQLRWIELLNMKDMVKAAETVPSNGAEPAEGLAHLEPGASQQPSLLAGAPNPLLGAPNPMAGMPTEI